jgi:predicted DNA-binding protein
MPTKKKRINLTIDNDLYRSLERLSFKKHQPISSVSRELIEKALELEEDLYFSSIGDKRLEEDKERFPHQSAWEDV